MMKLKFVGMAAVCLGCTLGTISCTNNGDDHTEVPQVHKLTADMIKVRDYVTKDAIVAHRGTAHWSPESTEASYRWAREAGADYLEADLQLTLDRHIVIVHDLDITHKTDIKEKFEGKTKVSELTLSQLRTLDAGSWFNKDPYNKTCWRKSFKGLHILTLKDLVKIAEGYHIKTYKTDGTSEYEIDPKWTSGNLPGLYLEVKEPSSNPTGSYIEKQLYDSLKAYGWNVAEPNGIGTETAPYKDGKVQVGKTNGKVILQTFSQTSLAKLDNLFKGKVPMCQLLFLDPSDGGSMHEDTPACMTQWINYAVDHHAVFMGPSLPVVIHDNPDETNPTAPYADLVKGWRAELIHSAGMQLHPYTFDKKENMETYYAITDGMFTNIALQSAKFYQSKGKRVGAPVANKTGDQIMDDLGYEK